MIEISGIYQIRCTETNQRYIGLSRNIKQRIRVHKRNLERGRHHNGKLQCLWDRFGSDSLEFTIIEVCPPDKLKPREDYHINYRRPELNIASTSNGPSKAYIDRMATRNRNIKKRLKKIGY